MRSQKRGSKKDQSHQTSSSSHVSDNLKSKPQCSGTSDVNSNDTRVDESRSVTPEIISSKSFSSTMNTTNSQSQGIDSSQSVIPETPLSILEDQKRSNKRRITTGKKAESDCQSSEDECRLTTSNFGCFLGKSPGFQDSSSSSEYNSSFPILPTPSPLNPTPSVEEPFFSDTESLNRKVKSKGKRLLTSSSEESLPLNNLEQGNDFQGFGKKSKLMCVPSKDMYINDDEMDSSLNLQLSSPITLNETTYFNAKSTKSKELENVNNRVSTMNDTNLQSNIESSIREGNDLSVIIIQPSEACRQSFFQSKIALFRLLQKSQFQEAKIKISKTNQAKGIQIIHYEDHTKTEELLKITKMGNFDVKCYIPKSESFKIGMIGPIELDIEEEEIVQLLIEQGFNNSKAQRLSVGKGANTRVTKTMKIYLEVESLPEKIAIMYRMFKVTPFVNKAWQCFKCQKFGHYASNCTNRNNCVLCSGNHSVKDCPNKEENSKKCCNCGGNHTASYGGCSKMKIEKKIQQVKAYQGLSYRDAVKAVKTTILSTEADRNNSDEEIRSYRDAVTTHSNNIPSISSEHHAETQIESIINAPKLTSSKTKPQMKDMAVQTTENKSTNAPDNIMPQVLSSHEKLAHCFIELFVTMVKNDSVAKKCVLMSKMFSDHLGINISKDHILASVKASGSSKQTQSPIINSRSIHNSRNDRTKT